MNKKKGFVVLTIAAVCWGLGYVFQSIGLRYLSPLAMVCTRYVVATIALIPVAIKSISPFGKGKDIWKKCAITGTINGIPMGLAMIFQQMGLKDTGAGKAAFLTSLYIVFTPLIGLFLKKKVQKKVWLAIIIALIGSYLLCATEGLSFGKGDLFVLLCAVMFAIQIHVLEKTGDNGYPIVHSLFTELTIALVSFVLMVIGHQSPDRNGIIASWLMILLAGVVAGAIADTLSVIGQRETDASISPIMMSLESVFGVLFGILLLHESLTVREIIGCLMILIGVIIAQI